MLTFNIMEQVPNFEQRETEITNLIETLAEEQGMNPYDILSDIITFAPYEGNEYSNPEYFEVIAEMMAISLKEITDYAIKKAKETDG